MESTILGYIGTTIRIHSFIPSGSGLRACPYWFLMIIPLMSIRQEKVAKPLSAPLAQPHAECRIPGHAV